MISNTDVITICHKGLDPVTRLETWTKSYYYNCWWYEVQGATVRDGYEANNRVEVRIPYDKNANITDISIGDILYRGKLENAVTSQNNVPNAFNITSITDNKFGNEPHLHLGGN